MTDSGGGGAPGYLARQESEGDMTETSLATPRPVAARLPDRPMGLMESYRAARRNILGIIPARALDLPVLSGRTGPQRWHMLMEPAAIRRVLLERVEGLSQVRGDEVDPAARHRRKPVRGRGRPLGAGSGGPPRRPFCGAPTWMR